ncbi:MAG: DUF4179 domain-containing protein, partial [Bacillota bacterium]
ELAQFVATSPSLSAAVENEFVQPVGQEQTQDEITARIEYLIVDQKQLNIFYSLDSEAYTNMEATPRVSSADGKPLQGYGLSSDSYGAENGELRRATLDFSEGTMPDVLTFILEVYDNGQKPDAHTTPPEENYTAPPEFVIEDSTFQDYEPPETLAHFSFSLFFDPAFTSKGEILQLNQDFELDGQKLTLISAEIYPTALYLTFDAAEENSAWLKSLSLYVENEKGQRFGGVANGVSALGTTDSPMMATYLLESPFFSKNKKLNLVITGADWLDKDKERIHLDLKNKTADWLPRGVTFTGADQHSEGWLLHFLVECEDGIHRQFWSWTYFDAEGREYSITSFSTSSAYGHEQSEDLDEVRLVLKDYHKDEVWLCPSFTRRTELETPVNIAIK